MEMPPATPAVVGTAPPLPVKTATSLEPLTQLVSAVPLYQFCSVVFQVPAPPRLVPVLSAGSHEYVVAWTVCIKPCPARGNNAPATMAADRSMEICLLRFRRWPD